MLRAILLILGLIIGQMAWAEGAEDCLTLDPWDNPDEALAACTQAAASKNDAAKQVLVLENLAIAQRELGHLQDSRDSLTAALGLAPDDAGLWHQLGWTDRLLGDDAAAERHLRAAIALGAGWRADLSLCVVLQDQARFADSVIPCKAALAEAGTNPDTTFFMARAYNHTASPSDALAAAETGLPLPNPGPRLYIEAAHAAFTLKDHPAALGYLKRGLDRYPFDRSLLKILIRIPMFKD